MISREKDSYAVNILCAVWSAAVPIRSLIRGHSVRSITETIPYLPKHCDRYAWENSVDPDQTQSIHCLQFRQYFRNQVRYWNDIVQYLRLIMWGIKPPEYFYTLLQPSPLPYSQVVLTKMKHSDRPDRHIFY